MPLSPESEIAIRNIKVVIENQFTFFTNIPGGKPMREAVDNMFNKIFSVKNIGSLRICVEDIREQEEE